MASKEPNPADREIFLKKAPVWNRLSMAKLVAEYLPYLNEGEEIPEPFRERSRVMHEDKWKFEHPETITREDMVDRLEAYLLDGIIGIHALDPFSPELREEVTEFLEEVHRGRN